MTAASLQRSILKVTDLSVSYGGVAALSRVGLSIEPGTVVGLIGPNGAGKTTLINAVTGLVRPNHGSIALGASRLDRLAQYRVARKGVARSYQNIRLFAALTVAQNVRAGAYGRRTALDDDAVRALMRRTAMQACPLDSIAGTLPYGEQRRLEIARALAGEPTILLLDEPAAGMNPRETHDLRDIIARIAADRIGVLLVEHNVSLVSAVCDRIVVLNFGQVIATGTPAQIARDSAVIEAYLGTEH